jgi:hypothetical protein
VHRLLYHEADESPRFGDVMERLAARLGGWRDDYRALHVFWVVSEFWDPDETPRNFTTYRRLGRLAEHRAWFIRLGETPGDYLAEAPAAAALFPRHQIVGTEVLWDGEPEDPADDGPADPLDGEDDEDWE